MYRYEEISGKEVVENWSKYDRHIKSLANVLQLKDTKEVIKRFSDTTFSDMRLHVLCYNDTIVGFTKPTINVKKYNEWSEQIQDAGYVPTRDYSLWSRQLFGEEEVTLLPKEMFKIGRLQIVDFLNKKFTESQILLRLVCTNMSYAKTGTTDSVTRVIGNPTKAETFLQQHTQPIMFQKIRGKLLSLRQQKANCLDVLGVFDSLKTLPITESDTELVPIMNKMMDVLHDIHSEYEPHKIPLSPINKAPEPLYVLRSQPTSWKKTALHSSYTNWDLWNDATFITSRIEERTNNYILTRPTHVKLGALLVDRSQMIIARKKTQQPAQ